MTAPELLLDRIEQGVVEHGGDLGGWTRRHDDTLQLFDGRVTLRANIEVQDVGDESARLHAHVLTTLHDYEDEVLDACVFGMGEDLEGAIGQTATIWILGVAGPIKSFLDNKPICATCQAGVIGGEASEGYSPGDYGLPGLRAFVGPAISRGYGDQQMEPPVGDTLPWFRYAAESAAPRRVHLVKASVLCRGEEGWSREIEIDGHDISHSDPDWPADRNSSQFGYMTRFAVFEFPANSAEIRRRAEVERAIRYFAEHYSEHETVDALKAAMVAEGFDPLIVHETEAISTIAFGRIYFEQHGVNYSPHIIRARNDGRIESEVPLMSIPAYNRARALAAKYFETMSEEDFRALCFYNAESNAILQAIESVGEELDLSEMRMGPSVVPDPGVSDTTMDAAINLLNEIMQRNQPAPEKKPWWKFW